MLGQLIMVDNVFIALGSNIGNRLANLEKALSLMEPVIKTHNCSSIYVTPPWGYLEQPEFFNQVCKCTTGFAPLELLSFLKEIEKEMGRKSSFLYGPRLIDLDILFYDKRVIEYPNLSIPHPHIEKRAFVLVPLMEIAPDFCHPVTGKTIREMYQAVDRQGIKKFILENDLEQYQDDK